MSAHVMKKIPAILISSIMILGLALSTGCANKAQTGAGAGALAGGLVGSLVSGDKLAGAAIGAAIGAGLGYVVGNEWDKYDQRQLNRTMESNRSGQTSAWTNPDTGARYAATPQPAYSNDGHVYRNVKIQSTIDGKTETVNAKAYRGEDGEWHLVQ